MLDFFRSPQFWALFAGTGGAMVLTGYLWASGPRARRLLATLILGATAAALVFTGVKLGIAAVGVAAVTGIILGALGLELGSDNAPKHAVVIDSVAEPAESTENVSLAS